MLKNIGEGSSTVGMCMLIQIWNILLEAMEYSSCSFDDSSIILIVLIFFFIITFYFARDTRKNIGPFKSLWFKDVYICYTPWIYMDLTQVNVL